MIGNAKSRTAAYICLLLLYVGYAFLIDTNAGFLIGASAAIATGAPFIVLSIVGLAIVRRVDALVLSIGGAIVLAFISFSGTLRYLEMIGQNSTYLQVFWENFLWSFVAFLTVFSLVKMVLLFVKPSTDKRGGG